MLIIQQIQIKGNVYGASRDGFRGVIVPAG
jgi:hypothetical protein